MDGLKKLPQHIGIIMDGNGRWAETRGLPRVEGHRKGAERAREMIAAASDLGIKCLTLYAFSTENWKRPEDEVSVLMKLLEIYLKKEFKEFQRLNIRYRAIGETWRLPKGIRALIEETERATAGNTGMTVASALSYSGRSEILRAVKEAIRKGMQEEEVTEESFSNLLDTAGLPPVDLIIRTSGEIRISNFLLWQAAYAELYFTNIFWPDFTRDEFMGAIENYRMRERRFGTVPAREF
jgi:undecaprenyl diphosphate synthase